jgi:hypothetical protein
VTCSIIRDLLERISRTLLSACALYPSLRPETHVIIPLIMITSPLDFAAEIDDPGFCRRDQQTRLTEKPTSTHSSKPLHIARLQLCFLSPYRDVSDVGFGDDRSPV